MILGDDITNHGLVNKALPRVCPLCVLEDIAASGIAAAGRCHWSILAIQRCHCHGAELIVLSGRANRGQGYDLSRLIGLNLGRIKTAVAVVEPRPETALERYLRTRVARRGQSIWPDRLALHVVARAAQALGCRILFGPDHRPRQLDADQLRHAGHTGFDILARGPDTLREILAGFDTAPCADPSHHKRNYGWFHQWLMGIRHSPEFERDPRRGPDSYRWRRALARWPRPGALAARCWAPRLTRVTSTPMDARATRFGFTWSRANRITKAFGLGRAWNGRTYFT